MKLKLTLVFLLLWVGIAAAQTNTFQANQAFVNNVNASFGQCPTGMAVIATYLGKAPTCATVASSATTSIIQHTLAQASPNITATNPTSATGGPVIDNYSVTLTQNLTAPIQLPASTAVQDSAVFHIEIGQGLNPYTLTTGDALSPLKAGAGTVIDNFRIGGCPSIGLTANNTLAMDVLYFAPAATYLLLDCDTYPFLGVEQNNTLLLPTAIWNTGMNAIANVGTTITFPTQATVAGTDVEFVGIGYQNGSLVTMPGGWVNVRVDCSGTNCNRIDYHIPVVGVPEPASYQWSFSGGGVMAHGGMVDVRNVNTQSPIDVSIGANTTAQTLNFMALNPTQTGELALFSVASGATVSFTTPLPQSIQALWNCNCTGNWGSTTGTFPLFSATGIGVNVEYAVAGGNTFAASEVLIKPAIGTAAPILTVAGVAGPQKIIGTYQGGVNQIIGYSADTNFNVLAYNADPTGSTDSAGDIQAAINAACAAQNGTAVPEVYIPSGVYFLAHGLILACGTTGTINNVRLTGAGRGQTTLTMSRNAIATSYGPAVMALPYNWISSINSGSITNSSLATGTGVSLFWATSSAKFGMDLGQVMHAIGLQPLNGLSALEIRGYVNIGSQTGDNGGAIIFASDGSQTQASGSGSNQCGFAGGYGSMWTCGGAATLGVDSNGALRFRANIGGTMVEVHSGNNVITTSATHKFDGVFDGSNVCLFVDGTRVATTAQAGTITQRADEDMTLGYVAQYFPNSSPVNRLWNDAPAQLDSFEIRKSVITGHTCGNASYTEANNKFTGDSNSLLLLNFDNLLGINGLTTQTSPALIGADYFNGTNMTPASGPAAQSAYTLVQNATLALGPPTQVDNMTITHDGVGLFIGPQQGGLFDHLEVDGQQCGIYLSSAFGNQLSNTVLTSGTSTIAPFCSSSFSNPTGIFYGDRIEVNSCGWACWLGGGGLAGEIHRLYVAPAAATVYAYIDSNLGNQLASLNLFDPTFDIEQGGAAIALLAQGPVTVNVVGGNLQSAGTSPEIELGTTGGQNTSIAVNVEGVDLGNSGANPTSVLAGLAAFTGGATGMGYFLNDLYANQMRANTLPSSITWTDANTTALVSSSGPVALGTVTTNQTCDLVSAPKLCSMTTGTNSALTVTLSRPVVNEPVTLRLCNDGSHSTNWSILAGTGVSNIRFSSGAGQPTWTTTANRGDMVTFNYDGTNLNEIGRSMNEACP